LHANVTSSFRPWSEGEKITTDPHNLSKKEDSLEKNSYHSRLRKRKKTWTRGLMRKVHSGETALLAARKKEENPKRAY